MITLNPNKFVAISAISLLSVTSAFALFDRKTTTEDGNAELDLPPYDGIKHAIGVLPVENTSIWRGSIDLVENMTIMLENVLLQSDRFVVVDRSNLNATIGEQDLQNSGRAAQANNVASTGQIRSAKYLAQCQITGVEANESGQSGGVGLGKFRVGLSGGKAQIEMIVKIFDSTTSEVVASQRVVGKAGKRGFSLGFNEPGFNTSIGGFSKTPLGEAAYDTVAQAVVYMAGEFEDYSMDASVVTVTGDGRIVINRGSQYNVGVGQRFQVQELGEVLIDPGTGEVLDRLEGAVTGTIEVTRVTDKVAYCKLVDGVAPQRGDTAIAI